MYNYYMYSRLYFVTHLINDNVGLEGAMKVILVSFCLSWDVLSTYKISTKSIHLQKLMPVNNSLTTSANFLNSGPENNLVFKCTIWKGTLSATY